MVDGAGTEPVIADVAVSQTVFTAVRQVEGETQRTLDAGGAHLQPGLVDFHTHFDGQVSWGLTFTPSNFHDVTTLLMGN